MVKNIYYRLDICKVFWYILFVSYFWYSVNFLFKNCNICIFYLSKLFLWFYGIYKLLYFLFVLVIKIKKKIKKSCFEWKYFWFIFMIILVFKSVNEDDKYGVMF